jgi:POT family proton-dependent oligopeptide transporter
MSGATSHGAADKGFFGHPRGLMTLFFTEMWERFSYYGMRAILMLFMTAAVVDGGLGFDAAKAGPIYAMYTCMVYLSTVPGGWIADNLLGQRRSVLYGGIVIMIGHILLAMHGLAFFYAGLAAVVIGTGLLKPNISVIVGQLYTQEDQRRDAGFSIFYMGINIGAFTSPLVCGWLAESPGFKEMLTGWGMDPSRSWHWGFGAAAVGMFFGLVQYLWTGKQLGSAGLRPSPPASPEHAASRRRTLRVSLGATGLFIAAIAGLAVARPELLSEDNINAAFSTLLLVIVVAFFAKLFLAGQWTRSERARLVTIFVLFCGAAIFWGLFEQAGSTFTLFARDSTQNTFMGREFPASWYQSINAIFIIVLAPVFAGIWIKLGPRDPSYPAKFAVGLLFAGLGFAVLIGGAIAAKGGVRVSPLWLIAVYFLHTIGELCLSPVGLSSMTKLAPVRVVSLMMGVWFLAASVGNFLAGRVSGYYESFELPTLLGLMAAVGGVMAFVMFLLVGPMKRMMAASVSEAPPGGGH